MRNPKPKEWLASDFSKGKIADYKCYSFVDGEGVRCSLYVSGCLFACKGCYNLAIQNFNFGQEFSRELQEKILEDISAEFCQGLSLLGGEPMLNTQILIPLCEEFRKRFGREKDIWLWTGYTFEELLEDSDDKIRLLSLVDVVIDGRFLEQKRDLSLRFRGSSNQRILHAPKSLEARTPVPYFEN